MNPFSADRTLDPQGLPAGYTFRAAYEITPRQAAGDARYLIIDVRELSELAQAHISHHLHIPLGQIQQRADEIEPEDGQIIATLCHHGMRSLKAALMLRELGFPDAVSIAGGIDLWSRAVDADVPRY